MTAKVLNVTFDTRPLERLSPEGIPLAGYHGRQIGALMEATRRQAIAEGYDEYEIKWWDFCEGWVTSRGSIKRRQP